MKDFVGKIIKIYLNSSSGWNTIAALYIKTESDFIVVRNEFSKKIEYISKYFIKRIEIIGDVDPKNEVDSDEK